MNIFLLIVIILFVVAAIDLIVGVSNDAVNFLNSAIGSKVANIKTILIIASLGILLGSVFSSGIMEVARKGIFHPELFTFDKIMYLFLAVMLTDIILLDLFNTLGLPTSTTVSIVFELLGAATMVGLLLTIDRGESFDKVANYINIPSAVNIVSGIFLSILFAFSFGAIAQWLSRFIFSFEYEKNLKRFGAVFAGLAITAIFYFLLIKGLKGTPFKEHAFYDWIKHHTWTAVAVLFVFWTIAIQLLMMLVRINPLKVVVLAGTFALAMAFAGNDLVNFIGVPIAGLEAFNAWNAGGQIDGMSMESLAGKVKVPLHLLILAGIIMATTLWLSSKARRVTETEVNLGRQDEGDERFRPNNIARTVVRSAIAVNKVFFLVVPKVLQEKMAESFKESKFTKALKVQDKPAFDLVRASVNLMMASIIISYATSKKMPLSTTYVSFMVAMGTSLADKAWGRESAVYRVAGVLSVIGGWLLTALIAFCSAAFFAFILVKLKMIGIIIVVALALLGLISSHLTYRRSRKKEKIIEADIDYDGQEINAIIENSAFRTVKVLKEVNKSYSMSLKALRRNNLEMLELSDDRIDELIRQNFKSRRKSIRQIKGLDTENLKVGEMFLLSSDYTQDITQSAKFLTDECLHYVKNLHRSLHPGFNDLIDALNIKVTTFLEKVQDRIQHRNFEDSDVIVEDRKELRAFINDELNKQISFIQNEGMSTKRAVLQTEILLQSRDIIAVALRMYKHYRNFSEMLIPPKLAEEIESAGEEE